MSEPFVSVVMPVRNEAGFIAKAVGAVLSQDYPSDRIEVVIADGMSDDGTREAVEAVEAGHPSRIPVRVVDNPGRTAPTGLNAGIAASTGEVVIRVDGHTVIARDYVRACVEELLRTGADNVGGRMVAKGETRFGEAVASATSVRFGVGGSRFHYSDREEEVDSVYLGAWPRAVFARVGGFDEEQVRNQDDEFNYRLRKMGGRVLLSPRIRSVYTVRGRPGRLFKQYLQYGYWKVRVFQKHPRQMSARHFVPGLFVGAVVVLSATAPFSRLGRLALAALLLAYLAAELVVSVASARRDGWRLLPVLPMVFPILHVAYGAGFLAGLWAFRDRWGGKGGAER